jgi:hypothetical protein
MEVIKFVIFMFPLAISGRSNRTGRHFYQNHERNPDNNLEVEDFHSNILLHKEKDPQLNNVISTVPRVVRVFGGFMKDTKTNVEGRIYASYHNQHCQVRESQCELSHPLVWIGKYKLTLNGCR